MKKILLLIGTIFILQICYWLILSSHLPTLERSGLFGDSFGALTALFSGLAFAGMIYAITLQSKELSLQRNELELQRNEMKASRAELAEQAKVMRAQFTSSIAQIKVSASQARIEALKLDMHGSAHSEKAETARREAQNIEELAQSLQSSSPLN